MKVLCLQCARLNTPNALAVPLPAWRRAEAQRCSNCGRVGEHRHTSVIINPPQEAAIEAQVPK